VTRPIYLDHHATTPVHPRVLGRMLPFFTEEYGNAASASHVFGWRAAQAVEASRAQVAGLIGARPSEVVFTSGATEAINLALLGVARAGRPGRTRVVTQVTEHAAVLDTVSALEREGFEVIRLGVDQVGRIRLDDLARVLDERTLVVSIMLANNEIGTIQPVEDIGRLCRAAGVLFHCDLTQAAGWHPINVGALGIDLAALSAHKLYGPKGIGAIVARRRRELPRLAPVLFGGGHEGGLRPGTLNVPAIVGFGEACDIAREEGPRVGQTMCELRDHLYHRLTRALSGVSLNGCPDRRHPGNLSLTVEGVHREALLGALPGVAFSGGSACASGATSRSHVISALGSERDAAVARFGLGRSTTIDEIDEAADRFVAAVTRLRHSGTTTPHGRVLAPEDRGTSRAPTEARSWPGVGREHPGGR
jgi:cysteine desulfurase